MGRVCEEWGQEGKWGVWETMGWVSGLGFASDQANEPNDLLTVMVSTAAMLDPIDRLRTRSTRILNALTTLLGQSTRWILFLDQR